MLHTAGSACQGPWSVISSSSSMSSPSEKELVISMVRACPPGPTMVSSILVMSIMAGSRWPSWRRAGHRSKVSSIGRLTVVLCLSSGLLGCPGGFGGGFFLFDNFLLLLSGFFDACEEQ